MKEYTYNPDPRCNEGCKYKSLEELRSSEEWKGDNAKYFFQQHIPNFCEGFDYHVLTFETIEELLEFFSKKSKNCLLKLQHDGEEYACLMEYRWENENEGKEDEDGHRERYLKKNLGDKWKDYNWWWVLGYVYRKNGTTISKKECLERRCD